MTDEELRAQEIARVCLALHLQRATRSVTRTFDEVLRPAELTIGQFSLLMSLMQPNPPRMSALADELAMDRTTLTAYLKPLQRRGLVQVDAPPEDARSRVLSLTEAGREVLKVAYPLWRKAQEETLERAQLKNADHFRKDLRTLSF